MADIAVKFGLPLGWRYETGAEIVRRMGQGGMFWAVEDRVVTNDEIYAQILVCGEHALRASKSVIAQKAGARMCGHISMAMTEGEYASDEQPSGFILVPLFVSDVEVWATVGIKTKGKQPAMAELLLPENSTTRMRTALEITEFEGNAAVGLGYFGPGMGRLPMRKRILSFLGSQYYTVEPCRNVGHFEYDFSQKDTRVKSPHSPKILANVWMLLRTGECYSCAFQDDLVPDIDKK